jgi:hypothetical protein
LNPAAMLMAFLSIATVATGQGAGAPGKGSKPSAKVIPLTPEREAAALAFANANHPELAELLGNLKTMDETQYKAAVSSLASQADSLAAIAKRDPNVHAVAVKEWKVQSRVSVLAAKVMHLDPAARSAVEGELRTLLEEQSSLRIVRKELEVKRAAEQLRKSEEQLVKLKADREAWVAQQLKRWLRTKDRPKARKTGELPSKKPGSNP